MRLTRFAGPLLCILASPALAQTPTTPVSTQPTFAAQGTSPVLLQADPGVSLALEQVIGLSPLLDQLQTLQHSGQSTSLGALNLRQQVLERILAASFDVDSVLGRIDTEAAYANEDRYVVQLRQQRQANALNLITFAASGALGAAGSAMQLTHGLNHAGTALQAASGGTSLVLSAVQLKATGGKVPVRSPYNMLAEVLDRPPNAGSHYPPLVMTYLHTPRADGQPPVAEGITTAWRRLHRLKESPRDDGAPVQDLVADRASGARLSADELADREAMLHDLHANLVLLRGDLHQVLMEIESTH